MVAKLAFVLLTLFFCAGCSFSPLSARSEYVRFEDRASFRVRAPDPGLCSCDFLGKRIVVDWCIPDACFCKETWTLKLHLRLCDQKVVERSVCLLRPRGTYVFSCLGDAYFASGGILTYKAELFCGDALFATWHHQLWAEWIDVGDSSK